MHIPGGSWWWNFEPKMGKQLETQEENRNWAARPQTHSAASEQPCDVMRAVLAEDSGMVICGAHERKIDMRKG